MVTRWLFADQLGSHFLDPDVDHIVLIENTSVLRRRRFHRAKAHLVLSAMRHFAQDSPVPVTYVVAEDYRQAWDQVPTHLKQLVQVIEPTSYAARRLVRTFTPDTQPLEILPSRGFVTSESDFATWVQGRGSKRLLLEDFYRNVRRRTGVLMDTGEPVGGQWNFDADNRLSPPRGRDTLGVPEPWWPTEDSIDDEVRAHLDRLAADGIEFVGRDDQRRFAVTADEVEQAMNHFIKHRLATFGPFEDAVMSGDWTMSHSLLSVPLNLGLIDPTDLTHRVEQAHLRGDVPLASAEGFIRQIIGWRDWVWHLHWHFGAEYVQTSNHLEAHNPVPSWFQDLDADAVQAACIKQALTDVRDHGWTHHIPRLMILGNWALQRGWNPAEVTDWFHRSFVDGYEWVMSANVVGMALHADGGRTTTKPYAAGGAYIKRMTNFCGGCPYRPEVRLGPQACPFTAGYWAFLDTQAERLRGNHRMAQPLKGLERLAGREDVVEQEAHRGHGPP
jgi:deoxyribodipyrimidine photolyase-related protein